MGVTLAGRERKREKEEAERRRAGELYRRAREFALRDGTTVVRKKNSRASKAVMRYQSAEGENRSEKSGGALGRALSFFRKMPSLHETKGCGRSKPWQRPKTTGIG